MRVRRAVTLAVVALAVPTLGPVAHADETAHPTPATSSTPATQLSAEASEQMTRAVAALEEARSRLPAATKELRKALADLAAAKTEDARLDQQLKQARQREQRALWDLELARAAVDESRSEAAQLARTSYMRGVTMPEVAAVLGPSSPGDLASRVALTNAVSRGQRAELGRLSERQRVVAGLETRLTLARLVAQTAKQRAQAVLVRRQALAQRASRSKQRVDALVAQRTAAYRAAEAARGGDERRYAGLQAENQRLQALLEGRGDERIATYDSSGTRWLRPVPGGITSPFGMRVHPVTGVYKLHTGTDFHAPCGQPISAAVGGRVLSASSTAAYGNRTVVDDGMIDGVRVTTTYNHQTSFAVAPGDTVRAGQVIGYVGTTGYSTGCHLHFEVLVDGEFTNPMRYL